MAIACGAFGGIVSTSDLQEEPEDGPPIGFHGDPCPPDRRHGAFTHPSTLRGIEVPGAGCASFVVEVWLGEFLFPASLMRGGESLDAIAPEDVLAAREGFGVEFLPGCHRGYALSRGP